MRTENLQQLIERNNRAQTALNIIGAFAVVGAIAAIILL